MGKAKRKKRKRRGQPSRKRGGAMMGMRSGFKGIAHSVAGGETSKKYVWWGRIITGALIVLAAVVLYQRCG